MEGDGSGAAMLPPPPRAPRGGATKPVGWERWWDERRTVAVPGRGAFNVYSAGSAGPVLLCLHGGGYTGLTWSLVAAKLKGAYRVVAPDLRGHGLTATGDDADLSAPTMAADVRALWQAMFGGAAGAAGAGGAEGAAEAPPPPPTPARTPTLLVGHSMGGGVAVWAAATTGPWPGLEGVVVVDVVEGTAIAALPAMRAVLDGRPARFASPEAAIEWALRAGVCRNRDAAAVSMPSQIVPDDGPAAVAAGGGGEPSAAGADGASGQPEPDSAQADASPSGGHSPANTPGAVSAGGACGGWRWRTDLFATERFWEGWYTGLSEAFLALGAPKLLILAGTDRLDRALTIGQMQGRFQLVLMPAAGHAIQEDEPERMAEHLLQFLKRFRIGEPPLAFPPRAPPGTRPALPIVAGPP